MTTEPTPTPDLTPTAVTVDGVVSVAPISLNPDQLYPILFLATLYVGVAFVRLVRSLTAPIGLKD